MPAKKAAARPAKKIAKSKPKPGASQTDPEVAQFIQTLDHPWKADVEALRQLILKVSPTIREGIKWKSPSFRTTEYFATMNLRNVGLMLILHTGAKINQNSVQGMAIEDAAGLLKWLGRDRASVTFAGGKDLKSKQAALIKLLAEWIRYV